MPYLFIIIVLVTLNLAGGSSGEIPGWADGIIPAGTAPLARAALILTPFLAMCIAGWAGVSQCVRSLDRRGRVGAIRWSYRIISTVRLAALAWHVVSVFLLGSLGLVRSVVADLILVDELIAAAPALLALLYTYRLAYPIERRIRDAMLIRSLDEGRPVYGFPSPWQYVIGAARNNLAIIAVPLVLILGWAEVLDYLLPMMPVFTPSAGEPTLLQSAGPAGLRVLGSIAIFALIPPVMTRVWDTVPIPHGELRTGLEDLARAHNVRLRRFLIWRTHGAMLNGAVIGLTPWLRYIVLTDALLDNLREPEVEAVAAHEVVHVRKHHMIWLALAVIGSAMFFGEGTALAVYMLNWSDSAVVWTSAVVSLVSVVLVLGAVSRRFEWQADAFAARHLSGPGAGQITQDGTAAMSSALERVARLNGMSEMKFTWRHGSIATRRRRLSALVGSPARRMPIDRHVRTVKVLTLLIFAGGVWLMVAGMLGYWPYSGPYALG